MTEDTLPEEPYVTHATVRESWTDDGLFGCWDIECRFSDGQKFAAIQVDHNFERLADLICGFLTLPKSQLELVKILIEQE